MYIINSLWWNITSHVKGYIYIGKVYPHELDLIKNKLTNYHDESIIYTKMYIAPRTPIYIFASAELADKSTQIPDLVLYVLPEKSLH